MDAKTHVNGLTASDAMEDEPTRFQRIKRSAGQILLFNATAMIVVVAFDLVFLGWERAFFWKELVRDLVYSNCIGTLVGVAVVRFVTRAEPGSRAVRFLKIVPLLLVCTFLGLGLGNIFLLPLKGVDGQATVLLPHLRDFEFSVVITFIYAASLYLYESSRERLKEAEEKLRQKQIAHVQLQFSVAEAQLAALQARVHPHFLFNTLNSIASLIPKEAAQAEAMIERLSGLLRYSLDTNTRTLVSVTQELDLIRSYLEIEKVRFGKRLDYLIEVEPSCSDVKIPPLAVQMLVENSIKHVAEKRSARTEITIVGKQNGNLAEITVTDNGSGFARDAVRDGHGIDILQKTLQSLFPSRAGLEINGGGERGVVTLKIPFYHG